MSLADLFRLLVKRKIALILVLLVSWAALSAALFFKPIRYHYQAVMRTPTYLYIHSYRQDLFPLSSSGRVVRHLLLAKPELAAKYKAEGKKVLLNILNATAASSVIWSPTSIIIYTDTLKAYEPQVQMVFNQLLDRYNQSKYHTSSYRNKILRGVITYKIDMKAKDHALQFSSPAAKEAYISADLKGIALIDNKILIPLTRNTQSRYVKLELLLLALILAFIFSVIITTCDKCFISIKDDLFNGTN